MLIQTCSALVGLFLIMLSAYLLSSNKYRARKNLPRVIFLILLQLVCAVVLLRTDGGLIVIRKVTEFFDALFRFALVGAQFVFGDLTGGDLARPENHIIRFNTIPFIFAVLIPIIFVSGLLGIMQWIGLLPLVTKYLGLCFSLMSKSGRLRGYFTCAALIFGQELAPIAAKKVVAKVPCERLLPLGVSAMATVSLSVVGAYMKLVSPRYVIAALVLNLLGTFVITLVISPPDEIDDRDIEMLRSDRDSFFGTYTDYLLDGAKVVAIVAVILVAFTATLALLNAMFSAVFHHSFQDVLGYIFSPIAFLCGISMEHAHHVGMVMATKIVSNEFVAMESMKHTLDRHTTAIISTFLISFANVSSIGVVSGAFRVIDNNQGRYIARSGLKMLVCANLINLLSGIIVGFVVI